MSESYGRRPTVFVVRLVRVTYLVGAGKMPNDPVREVEAYYDLDGELVFEVDSWLASRLPAPEPLPRSVG